MDSQFVCEICNKVLKSKQALQFHLNKKIPCNNKLECERCGYVAQTKQNLNTHINRKNKCKLIDKDNEIKQLKLQIQNLELKSKLQQYQSITNINNSNINSNNTINNTTNNTIILNNFGNEDAKYFTKKNIRELLLKQIDLYENHRADSVKESNVYVLEDGINTYTYRYVTIPVLNIAIFFLENLYKNEQYKQDHTIKYNFDDDTFKIYKDDEWHISSELDTINAIFAKIRHIIKKEKVLDKSFGKLKTPDGRDSSYDNIRMYVGEFDLKNDKYTTPEDHLIISRMNERGCLRYISSTLKNILSNKETSHKLLPKPEYDLESKQEQK